MKKILLALFGICLTVAASAQRVYFIYLQSENNAPFFVRMPDKLYSSSSSGYLILPNLKDSTYQFVVGFPSGKPAEARFAISMNQNDHGFLLKDFEGTPGLFDLQSMAVHRPIATTASSKTTVTRDDAFTKLLSQAANDESILTVAVEKKEDPAPAEVKKEVPAEQKTETIATTTDKAMKDTVAMNTEAVVIDTEVKTEIKNTDTVAVKTDVAVVMDTVATKSADVIPADTVAATTESKPAETIVTPPTETSPTDTVVVNTESQPVAPPAEDYKRSVVTRRSESSTTEGFGLVFIDQHEAGNDTIRLLIPTPRTPFRQEVPVQPQQAVQQTPVENKTDSTVSPETNTTTTANVKTDAPPVSDAARPKPVCAAEAGDSDFKKLRKYMAAESSEDEMVEEARKYFRSKCFSVEQVKLLSTLFLTQLGKYQFFDAAYMHVTNQSQFGSLRSELTDEYFVNRFKALIGE